MAGQTLQEILAGLGVQQGVAQVKKGRSEGKIIDKIIAKIKADLKAIDDNRRNSSRSAKQNRQRLQEAIYVGSGESRSA